MLDDWMRDFAQELETGSLATESPGSYEIPMDEDLKIAVTSLGQGYNLFSVLAACPKINKENFFSKVMQANLFGQGTHGAVLGLTEEGNMLTLSQFVDYTTNYKDFRDVVEDFINTVDFWREEARNHK
jgi:hypothetical protein